MLGLGLSLTIANFTRVVRYPKAVVVGLFRQMFVLTGICFGITIMFKLPPELAVGMMLLAASPAALWPISTATSHMVISRSISR